MRKTHGPICDRKMETWFWILGWSLSILTIAGNGFIIVLVCSKRRLRTETNAFVVSFAVADFCVGLSVVPSLFLCEIATECELHSDKKFSDSDGITFIWRLFGYASSINLCSLVLDRYTPVVKPLKYLTLMKHRRVVQMISLSWAVPVVFVLVSTVIWFIFNISLIFDMFLWLLVILFELFPCFLLIFCFTSMSLVVYKHDRAARTLAKQLHFNHRCLVKIHEKSAVIIMGIVIGVFLVCYGFFLRCSYHIIFNEKLSYDIIKSKVLLLVLNSAINPVAYAFFKRDIKMEMNEFLSVTRNCDMLQLTLDTLLLPKPYGMLNENRNPV